MMIHNLFINYYTTPNAERQRELDYCLLKNLEVFDTVFIVCTQVDFDKLPELIPFKERLFPIIHENRPFFSDFFYLIGQQEGTKDAINIIANSDIMFPKITLINSETYFVSTEKRCLALTRWDITDLNGVGGDIFFDREDSQDCWIFKGLVDDLPMNFPLGVCGCDNSVAYLLEQAGCEVLNPSRSLKTFHFHLKGEHNYLRDAKGNVVHSPGPYKSVKIEGTTEMVPVRDVTTTGPPPQPLAEPTLDHPHSVKQKEVIYDEPNKEIVTPAKIIDHEVVITLLPKDEPLQVTVKSKKAKKNKIVCITSIAPNHHNNDIQLQAVQSWINLGFKVISINSKSECEALENFYPDVLFVPTTRTMELTYGRPVVSISAALDLCKLQEEDNFLLINSDIELVADDGLIGRIKYQMEKKVIIGNRYNYSDSKDQSSLFISGFDFFFINKNFLSLFPQSLFAFGQCHWDYFIPYTSMKAGIETILLENKIAFHKDHPVQYSLDLWNKTGRYFLLEAELEKQFEGVDPVGRGTQFIHDFIYANAKRMAI